MESELRFILLGKVGVGKSATGNFILKKNAFMSRRCLNAVTKAISSDTSSLVFDRRRVTVTVVDTPGLFGNETPILETVMQIQNSLDLAIPGPNAFLLVIKLDRLTVEDDETVGLLRLTFGNQFLNYTIVIFTHEDKIDGDFMNEMYENKTLKDLLDDCGERYITLNTSESNDEVINLKLERLLRLANNVSDNGNTYYAENIDIYRNPILKYAKEYTGTRLLSEQIKLILREQEEERKRQMLRTGVKVAGAVVVVGAAVGAAVYAAGPVAAGAVAANAIGGAVAKIFTRNP